ncbi:unnamed protein product [Ranitomeya imitator]|uniref:Reelin n=1 Tax=Ranitomeya imitator TaxID=111125 RepID=A0ABN9M7F6_9NEOB|nr:unnamed protein product [Ranitomeya imitator]
MLPAAPVPSNALRAMTSDDVVVSQDRYIIGNPQVKSAQKTLEIRGKSAGSGLCRFSYSDPGIIVSYAKNNATNWMLLEKISAPSNVSAIIHIIYLPYEAKGENVWFRWAQEPTQAGDVYEACWALDNILIINSAHKQVILEDNLDPMDTGNWLFFPGATVKFCGKWGTFLALTVSSCGPDDVVSSGGPGDGGVLSRS